MRYLIITIYLFLPHCSISQNTKNVYSNGDSILFYAYTIQNNEDTTHTDSILMVIEDNPLTQTFFNQIQISYNYLSRLDKNGKTIIEKTGIVVDSNYVYIHPPRKSFMSFAEIPPQPSINLPPQIGTKKETKLKIIKGWGSLNGKTISQRSEIMKIEPLKLFDKTYEGSVLTKGTNTSHIQELGEFTIKHWFKKDFGFIRLRYEKPKGDVIDIKLKSYSRSRK